MIVACRNTSDLNSCISNLGNRDEFEIFKAECKDPCYNEVRSFYGIYVTNQKVTTSFDDLSKEDLQNKFPFIDPSVIEKVNLYSIYLYYVIFFCFSFVVSVYITCSICHI
jgi:hypothetical protein